MIDSLSLTITLACLLLAIGALVVTVGAGFRADRFRAAGFVIEGALVLQAVLAVVGLLRGHRSPDAATFVAYLAFSVIVLPVAASQVRGTAGRWAGAVVVTAFVVQAVVVVRMQTTWRNA